MIKKTYEFPKTLTLTLTYLDAGEGLGPDGETGHITQHDGQRRTQRVERLE